jgi:hypothetical protein
VARKLTPKQVRYFGTKAQKAALRRKRSGTRKASRPKKSGKKRKYTPPSLWKRTKRWAKKHPVKTTLAVTGLAGVGTLAASETARQAVADTARNTAAVLRAPL